MQHCEILPWIKEPVMTFVTRICCATEEVTSTPRGSVGSTSTYVPSRAAVAVPVITGISNSSLYTASEMFSGLATA